MIGRLALVFVLALALGCSKKDDAPPPEKLDKKQVVDRALATAQGTAVQAGKGAIVAQECAITCQAKPGIDPGECTPKCVKTCMSENDTVAIDACATRIANESPQL